MSTPLEDDLARLLKNITWGSPEMSKVITSYIGQSFKRLGVGLALSFTPLAEKGLEGAGFVPTAAKLGELQQLGVAGREELYRRAWKRANGSEPPRGAGVQSWVLDLALETAHQLRKN